MMLTRCPYCSAIFRVTAEQLQVRQGQVRCGQCRRVFDGVVGLVEGQPPPPAAPLPITLASVVPPPITRPPVAPPPPVTPLPVIQPKPEPRPEPKPEPKPELKHEPRFEPRVEPKPEPKFEPKPAPKPEPRSEPRLGPKPAPKPAPKPSSAESEYIEINDPFGPLSEPPADDDPEPAVDARPHLKLSRRKFAPESDLNPPTILDLHDAPPAEVHARWPWIVGSLLLFLLATGQLLLYFRTELITSAPATRPAFVAACKIFGCQISLPRKINLISIEASGLSPDEKQSGVLHLSAQLRNRASHAQAWPHLEITLTDAHERLLLRRTLTPAEFLPAGVESGKGFPARSEQAIQLTLTTDIPAVGYRLYIFHP